MRRISKSIRVWLVTCGSLQSGKKWPTQVWKKRVRKIATVVGQGTDRFGETNCYKTHV